MMPTGPFSVIVADPPWMYQKSPGSKGPRDGANGIAERHYPTMTNKDIGDLPVKSIAAEDAHLFLWVTNPYMYGGRFSNITPEQIANAWGFEYKTTLTWVKTKKTGEPTGGGLGWFFRGATEHIIYATRGKAKIPPHLREKNVILAPTGRHSAKPPEFMELVERVTTGPRIELFARTPRTGWVAWGNEIEDKDLAA
jgi:N6-adenosine-specific RNA methylase IME4